MGAGRPTLPATTKKLQGTDRADRQREVVEYAQITVVPKPEVWLDTKAKTNFKNICKLLIDKCMLTDANVGHALIMAQELSTYETACRELKKKGAYVEKTATGYKQPSPWVAIRNQAQKNYKDYAALFGLDPVSAQKVGGLKATEKDPFEQLQNKYNE